MACGSILLAGQTRCGVCGTAVSSTGSAPGAERRSIPRRALMTELATQALDLSDTFNVMFEGRFVGLHVDLAKPGISTEGGKKSVQHIALHAPGGESLVVGSVDTFTHRAELRSFSRVAALYRQRLGTTLPIAAGAWAGFLDRAQKFLTEEGFAVDRDAETATTPAPDPRPVERRGGASRGVPLWLALVIALALAGAAVGVTVLLIGPGAAPATVSPPAIP